MPLSEAAKLAIARARAESISRANPHLESLPSWVEEFRPHQIAAVKEVTAAFGRVPVVVLDAPTGSGKTLIAETVRRMLMTKALYVCTTKGLQDQFSEDFEYAKVLKGRSNYPTHLYPQRFGSAFDSISAADCNKKKGDPESCKWCPHVSLCPYEQAKRNALRAELAVLNTSYLLTEANGPGRFGEQKNRDGELTRRPFIIVDEADLLEKELMGYVSIEIGERRTNRYGLKPPEKVTVADSWKEWLDDTIPKLESALQQIPEFAEDVREIREAKWLEGTVDKLWLIRKGLDEEGHTWVYTGRDNNISFKPSRVDDLGGRYLWRHADKWLLMSATVISAQEMLESLGYRGAYEVVSVANTFPVENRRVKIMGVANMTNKNKDVAYPEVCRAVTELVTRHPDDRVLVHTVSYDLARAVFDHLRRSGGGNGGGNRIILTYADSRDRDGVLGKFRTTPRGVLVAPSMDRGIDLPHDACRVQIIAKVPFPNLGDRQISARLHSRGGQVWYTVQTVRTIVQMCGRAVRSADDWAVTYILDKQFESGVWSRGGRGLFPRWFVDALDWSRGR